jgi:hypothetical protein
LRGLLGRIKGQCAIQPQEVLRLQGLNPFRNCEQIDELLHGQAGSYNIDVASMLCHEASASIYFLDGWPTCNDYNFSLCSPESTVNISNTAIREQVRLTVPPSLLLGVL